MNDLERLLHIAVREGASDLHIVAGAPPQLRIDGVLVPMNREPLSTTDAQQLCVERLDASHTQALQDQGVVGFSFDLSPEARVRAHLYTQRGSLAGTFHVIATTLIPFEDLCLPAHLIKPNRPGLTLVTGPGGSGKSATLHAIIDRMNREECLHIATLEDPIEHVHASRSCLMTQREIGVDAHSFADALFILFRQNADVLCLGEIRDFETANIAVKAALTGHMVLSTLHTNNATGTINRLLNMGVKPFLVTSSLNCIVAQRLGRKVCVDCKEAIQLTREEMRELEVPDDKLDQPIYRGRGTGCTTCGGSGYKGRIAFYEVLYMNDEVKEGILMGMSCAEIKDEAIRMGMETLRMHAVTLMLQGITSPEEVAQHTSPDH